VNQHWLVFADWFLVLFHSIFILLVVFGWIPTLTRRLQLWAVLLTLFSWLGLGIFFGLGYCPLTDLHWWILQELQTPGLPRSYTQYLIQKILGIPAPAMMVDVATVVGLVIGLFGAGFHSLRKNYPKRI